MAKLRARKPSYDPMKKVLSRLIGPVACPPNWLRLKLPSLLAAPVVEKVIGVEDRIAQKFIGAAVKLVGARFENDVEHAAQAAAEFRRIGRAHHLEFLNRINRREDRDAGKAIDRRE